MPVLLIIVIAVLFITSVFIHENVDQWRMRYDKEYILIALLNWVHFSADNSALDLNFLDMYSLKYV
jgi:hypothetical protein